jgi:hypothetical protein
MSLVVDKLLLEQVTSRLLLPVISPELCIHLLLSLTCAIGQVSRTPLGFSSDTAFGWTQNKGINLFIRELPSDSYIQISE